MSTIEVPGWENREGSDYWGHDRLKAMIEHKDDYVEELPLFEQVWHIFGWPPMIADIGCGIGNRSGQIPDGYIYVGIDREEVMIEKAKELRPNLDFYISDAQEILSNYPALESAFDCVLTYHVLMYNHIEQQDAIIKQIYRMLKSYGHFYMKEGTIYEDNNIGYDDLNDVRSINGINYTTNGWINKVERLGFEYVDHQREGHFLFRKRSA